MVDVINVKDLFRHNWSRTKFDYPRVYDAVMNSDRVNYEIRRVAGIKTEEEKDDFESNLKRQKQRAVDLLKDMHTNLTHLILFLTSFILHKAFPRILSGITVNSKKARMLKAAQRTMPGVPFIFLPLHRSHMDYVLLTFYLFNNSIRSPLVAAGNNLKIPIFGSHLKGVGAFFIKRKIDPEDGRKDFVYRSILQTYMEQSLKLKHNFEFFIE